MIVMCRDAKPWMYEHNKKMMKDGIDSCIEIEQ
jgi:hypothetical protein